MTVVHTFPDVSADVIGQVFIKEHGMWGDTPWLIIGLDPPDPHYESSEGMFFYLTADGSVF